MPLPKPAIEFLMAQLPKLQKQLPKLVRARVEWVPEHKLHIKIAHLGAMLHGASERGLANGLQQLLTADPPTLELSVVDITADMHSCMVLAVCTLPCEALHQLYATASTFTKATSGVPPLLLCAPHVELGMLRASSGLTAHAETVVLLGDSLERQIHNWPAVGTLEVYGARPELLGAGWDPVWECKRAQPASKLRRMGINVGSHHQPSREPGCVDLWSPNRK